MENKNKQKQPAQSVDYQFIPVPRELYYNPEYAALPNDAKHLFILIIDRLRLSQTNPDRFADSDGKAFVYLTLEEVTEKLGISKPSAVKLFDKLLQSDFITKSRQGLCKPNIIQLGSEGTKIIQNYYRNSNKLTSGSKNNLPPEVNEFNPNNNKENNNENNKNHSTSYEMAVDEIKEQIGYDYLIHVVDTQVLDNIVDIMYDVMYTQANTVRIGANIYPKSAVFARFSKIGTEETEDVIEALETAETPIRNVRAFLISELYKAPSQSAAKTAELFARTQRNRF